MLHVLLQCVSRQCFSLCLSLVSRLFPLHSSHVSVSCFSLFKMHAPADVSVCMCTHLHSRTHTLTFLFPRIPSPSHRRSFPPSRPKVSSRYSKLTCLSLTATTFALYHHFLLPSAELGLFLDFTSTTHVQTHTLLSSEKKKKYGTQEEVALMTT